MHPRDQFDPDPVRSGRIFSADPRALRSPIPLGRPHRHRHPGHPTWGFSPDYASMPPPPPRSWRPSQEHVHSAADTLAAFNRLVAASPLPRQLSRSSMQDLERDWQQKHKGSDVVASPTTTTTTRRKRRRETDMSQGTRRRQRARRIISSEEEEEDDQEAKEEEEEEEEEKVELELELEPPSPPPTPPPRRSRRARKSRKKQSVKKSSSPTPLRRSARTAAMVTKRNAQTKPQTSKKTPRRKRRVSRHGGLDALTPPATPSATVASVTQRTRSGRRVFRPVQAWANERIMDGVHISGNADRNEVLAQVRSSSLFDLGAEPVPAPRRAPTRQGPIRDAPSPTVSVTTPRASSPRRKPKRVAWTPSEVRALKAAHAAADPSVRGFWSRVSRAMDQRTPKACQSKFESLFPTPGGRKKKRKTKTAPSPKGTEEMMAIIPAKGRAPQKRRRMLRRLAEAANEHSGDDAFDDGAGRRLLRSRRVPNEAALDALDKVVVPDMDEQDTEEEEGVSPGTRDKREAYISRLKNRRGRASKAASRRHSLGRAVKVDRARQRMHDAVKTVGAAVFNDVDEEEEEEINSNASDASMEE